MEDNDVEELLRENRRLANKLAGEQSLNVLRAVRFVTDYTIVIAEPLSTVDPAEQGVTGRREPWPTVSRPATTE